MQKKKLNRQQGKAAELGVQEIRDKIGNASLSVHIVVSLDIMHAEHVTVYLINMVFVGGTHSEVGTVPQHPVLH